MVKTKPAMAQKVQKTQARKKSRKKVKRRVNRHRNTLVLWLLLCFPVGLFRMWSKNVHWPAWTKCAISALCALVVTAVFIPITMPNDYAVDSVKYTYVELEEDIAGPEMAEDESATDIYVPVYVPDVSVIAEPTPTPVPIYVYCNDGGQYYHAENCYYVRKTTPKVTLSQAVNAGFKQCPKCDCPNAKGVYKSAQTTNEY